MRVRLRAILEKDYFKLLEWVNDREVIKFSNYFRPVSEPEHREWYLSLVTKQDQRLFGIELIETEQLIGTCGLFDIDFISRKAELRIKIGDKQYWGNGLGTEAVQLLLEYGFATLNLNKIWLKVLKDNSRAIKSYEKVNFVIEGKLREDMYVENEYKDIIVMSILKKEWKWKLLNR